MPMTRLVACVLLSLAVFMPGRGRAEEPVTVPTVLDLPTAQALALRQNPGLAAVAERVEQARQRVRQARSLYFPQLRATYSASHTELADSIVEDARRQAGTAAVTPYIQQRLGTALSGVSLPAGFGLTAGQTTLNVLRAREAVPTDVESYSASIVASYILFDGFSRKYTNAIARFGRAKNLGDRTLGHQDPGARSIALIFKGFAQALR